MTLFISISFENIYYHMLRVSKSNSSPPPPQKYHQSDNKSILVGPCHGDGDSDVDGDCKFSSLIRKLTSKRGGVLILFLLIQFFNASINKLSTFDDVDDDNRQIKQWMRGMMLWIPFKYYLPMEWTSMLSIGFAGLNLMSDD